MGLVAGLANGLAAPAVLAVALGGACLAQTTPAADAVAAQCARLYFPARVLQQDLDAIPGLIRLPPDALAPETAHGRALRMVLAYSRALEAILATTLVAPSEMLSREYAAILADTPFLFSQPGLGGGVAAYIDGDGHLFVIDRAVTTGRQGRWGTRCLFIAPPGAAPLVPGLPESLRITATPAFSARGFLVSALQGQIPLSIDPPTDGFVGFSMVTTPVPPDTAIAELAGIGGVTIFLQSTSNRSSE